MVHWYTSIISSLQKVICLVYLFFLYECTYMHIWQEKRKCYQSVLLNNIDEEHMREFGMWKMQIEVWTSHHKQKFVNLRVTRWIIKSNWHRNLQSWGEMEWGFGYDMMSNCQSSFPLEIETKKGVICQTS